MILENPSADGPFGAKAIGEMANNAQPPAIAAAIHDAVGVWVTEMPATPERVLRAIQAKAEPRREGKRVIFDEEISLGAVSSNGGEGFWGVEPEAQGSFRSWNGARSLRVRRWREPARHRRRAGAALPGSLRAGQQVPRHSHEHTEQLMWMLEGSVTHDRRRRDPRAAAGRRGLRQPRRRARAALEGGVTFFEALAPVPLDHVADRGLDLVLGPDGGAGHVER